MNVAEKVALLKSKIVEVLTPLIQSDYWLLEVPHYSNVGDTLIWQGELDFLKRVKYCCLGMRSYDSRTFPKIKKGDTVLFQGGGNFGDLWEAPHNYRKRIMERYPDSKFLIFPQTVWYEDDENLKKDADFFAKYDCTICVRDTRSYETLKSIFQNEILLLPDMAFCIDMTKWYQDHKTITKNLLIRRFDKEFKGDARLIDLEKQADIEVADWIPMTTVSLVDRLRFLVQRTRIGRHLFYELFMFFVYRPYLIRAGVKQLSSFNKIYTTRLHACILSILLNKQGVVFFDNSYGKNRSFYETWLQDCDELTMEN